MFINDNENAKAFEQQIARMKTTYGEEKTWHVSRFDAFRNETERQIRLMIEGQLQIEWEKILTNTNNPTIKLTVRSLDYGSLSTEISWNLLHDERCPRDLPRQLATHFKSKMGMKIDKLKRLLIKHENALKQMEETPITEPPINNKQEKIEETPSKPETKPEVVPELPPEVDSNYDFDLYKLLDEEKKAEAQEEVIKEDNKKDKKKNKKK